MAKMKSKRLFSFSFSAILLTVTVVILALNVWRRWESLRPVTHTVERFITERGIIYDIYDSREDTLWLREISADGRLLSAVSFPKRNMDKNEKNTVHLLAAQDGLVYLRISDLPYSSPQNLTNRIAVCDMRTGEVRTLCDLQIGEGWLSVAETVYDGGIYYTEVNEADGKLTLYRADVKSGEVRLWDKVSFPFILSSFTVTGDGLSVLSQDSRVYRPEDEDWVEIYRPEDGTAVVQLLTAGNGELYLFTSNPETGEDFLWLDPETDDFGAVRDENLNWLRASVQTESTWVALTKDHTYQTSSSGDIHTFSSLTVPVRFLFPAETLIMAALEAAIAVLILSVIRFIWRRKRISLLLKLSFSILPVFAAGAVIIIMVSVSRVEGLMVDTVRSSLTSDAKEVVSDINTAELANVNWNDPFSSKNYKTLRKDLLELSGSYEVTLFDGPDEFTVSRYINFWLYRVEGNSIYTAACDNSIINLDLQYYDLFSEGEEKEYLQKNLTAPLFLREYDLFDEDIWLSLLYPIVNDGTVIGILEVSTPEWEFSADIDNVRNQMIRMCLYVFLALSAALTAVLAVTLRAMGKLRRGAAAIAEGKYDTRVSLRNLDETGEIAQAFNSMASSVASAITETRAVSDGYSRFVPREMLTILNKPSIREIRASDYIETKAMFLLLMTESFDQHDDHLDALNRFYTRLLPVLSEHGGVVERFNSRELRALLACPPDEAADAALAMLAAINRLNEEAGNPIECSILLAYADSFLGVTGDDSRLNMMLFSRFSHKTEEVRKAGFLYGCRLMVEQGAYEAIGGDKYRSRKLGRINDSGTARDLYDFYDGDPPEQIQKKDASRELFETAVTCYYNADYEEARAGFMEILKRRQDDPSSREYLKCSHARQKSITPPEVLFTV